MADETKTVPPVSRATARAITDAQIEVLGAVIEAVGDTAKNTGGDVSTALMRLGARLGSQQGKLLALRASLDA